MPKKSQRRKPLFQLTDAQLKTIAASKTASTQERKMARTILVNRTVRKRNR